MKGNEMFKTVSLIGLGLVMAWPSVVGLLPAEIQSAVTLVFVLVVGGFGVAVVRQVMK